MDGFELRSTEGAVAGGARRAVCLEASGSGSRLFGQLSVRRMAAVACAEFLGLGLVVFLGCMSAVVTPEGEPELVQVALAFGFAVVAAVKFTHQVSEGHLNPAVTLGAALRGDITLPAAAVYVIAQLAGSSLAYGLLLAVMPESVTCDCTTVPKQGCTEAQAFGIEAMGATGLVMTAHAIWDRRNRGTGDAAPVKLGLLVSSYALASGHYTGGSMNPARSFGPAIWHNIWDGHWVYWVGPMTGSVLASLVYLTVFEDHHASQPAQHKKAGIVEVSTVCRDGI
ncbi:uncharacterized protein LOC126263292 [Schistocerca nitens]|uniref:uncharacterized protein LOC126263292 n=1 Tax=Schistocerca nitens TaxID=7011 RepID=UPI0021195598|nr:uncharacterized protein LOC126263292 [Schistocerca nitens]